MKSKRLGGAVLAAGMLAAVASPAAANTYAYPFGTPSGGPYCDGITLTNTGTQPYSGFHLNSDCNHDNEPAGGFKMKNSGLGTVIEGVTLNPADGYAVSAQMYYLDTKHKTWYLYEIGGEFNVYTEIASGRLVKGAPPANKKGGVSSLHPANSVKMNSMLAF